MKMQQCIVTMPAFTLLETLMHINNRLPQHGNKTKSDRLRAEFDNNQHSSYRTVGEKIHVCLQNRNDEFSPDMIEKFYFHLLPVTYRDWMCK